MKDTKPYFTVNPETITKAGLRALIRAFSRHKQVLTAFEGNNKPKKRDGQLMKTATLYFDSGQSITLDVNGTGDVTQTKLNGRVIPVQQHTTVGHYAKEVAGIVAANQAVFSRSLAKKNARLIANNSDTHVVDKSLDQQHNEIEASLDELTQTHAALVAQKKQLIITVARKDRQLVAERATLAQLKEQVLTVNETVQETPNA
jgi:hypothetical protein